MSFSVFSLRKNLTDNTCMTTVNNMNRPCDLYDRHNYGHDLPPLHLVCESVQSPHLLLLVFHNTDTFCLPRTSPFTLDLSVPL